MNEVFGEFNRYVRRLRLLPSSVKKCARFENAFKLDASITCSMLDMLLSLEAFISAYNADGEFKRNAKLEMLAAVRKESLLVLHPQFSANQSLMASARRAT